ncbi:MAG: hypothetical protein U5N26_06625 [Candidatus Marinimicrobia bacterium]|nr:hypothetical protein [Candidatus Neomarinimicrobiota bacterium]
MTRRGPEGAVEYESRLSVDSEDTVSVRVNRPFSRGQMRLYQSEHRLLTPYHICLEGDTLKLFAGQNGTLRGACLCFQGYDPGRERAEIRYNEVPFYLPVEKKQRFMEQDLYIYAGEPEIGTVLEYVEVRGHRILLIIAAMILLTLVYAVVKRK